MNRSRLLYLVVACVVIVLGLASRRYAAHLPAFVAEYAGDTLWALMALICVGLLAPRWSSLRVAAAALTVSYLVEVSQLYHSPWIDSIRHSRIGGLMLGYGFLWSDLVCYSVGVAIGLMLEIGVLGRKGS